MSSEQITSDGLDGEHVRAIHQLLDSMGVPPCNSGEVCDNPECDSKIYHRVEWVHAKMNSWLKQIDINNETIGRLVDITKQQVGRV